MFYNIKNKTEENADLYIYGDIVSEKTPDWWTGEVSENDIDLKEFRETLDSLKPDSTLNVHISSGGGSVFAASTMVTMLKRAKANGTKVVAWIDGLAASAASFFPMVADEVNYYRNSILMVHKPMIGLLGYLNATELKKAIDELNALEDNIMMPLYEKNSTHSHTELKNLVKNESWLGKNEIAEYFPNFNYIDEEKEAAACISDCFSNYKNIPEKYKKTAKAEGKHVVNEAEKPTKPIDYSDFENIIKNLKKENK